MLYSVAARTDRVITVSVLITLEVVQEGKAADTVTPDPLPPSSKFVGLRDKVTSESLSSTANFVPVTLKEGEELPPTLMVSSSSATVSLFMVKADKDLAAEERVLAGICTVISLPELGAV